MKMVDVDTVLFAIQSVSFSKHLNKEAALKLVHIAVEEKAVDAVPVAHGAWVDHMVRDWRCSVCGEKIHKIRNVDGYCYDDKPNYCPNCGAKMDGGKDNATD